MTPQELRDHLRSRGRLDDMEELFKKLGFSEEFVAASVLTGQPTVTVSRVAMLWQGMPNKHDRKRTRTLFDALTEAGLLVAAGDDETWTVPQREA